MNDFLKQAIELSKESVNKGGFPVGAIVVKNGEIVGKGLSNGKNNKDATSHAEIEAIRNASKNLNSRDLFDCEIYSSMEPCLMCFSACYWAKIKKIVYAVAKDKLDKQHYEGLHHISEINSKNNRQIEIFHDKELEQEALLIIKNWESKK
ncbi:MAG: nucleoside deaminase [Candidatus Paceibacterota bacterium]|jgi:guanine deaminase